MKAEVLDHYLRFVFYVSGAPVHLYRGSRVLFVHARDFGSEALDPERIAVWAPTGFHPDTLLEPGEHIGYRVSSELIAVGEVREKSGDLRVILGPVLLGELTEAALQRMLLEYDIPAGELQRLARHLRGTPRMTLDTFLWFLSAINITVNREIWNLREGMLDGLSAEREMDNAALFSERNEGLRSSPRLAYEYEQQLLGYLEQGDTDGLMAWWNNAAGVAGGTEEAVSDGFTRRVRTRFVSAAALFSRTAIRAGLSPETAFPLCDYYIDLAARRKNPAMLEKLTTQMLRDFCERVRQVRGRKTGSALVNGAVARITDRIDRPPRVGELAEELGVTPEYLSACFKKTMGVTVSAFIREQRIERAKRLLRYSDRSLSDIAAYLSFSSQSHFQNTFRAVTGMTPREYRDGK